MKKQFEDPEINVEKFEIMDEINTKVSDVPGIPDDGGDDDLVWPDVW